MTRFLLAITLFFVSNVNAQNLELRANIGTNLLSGATLINKTSRNNLGYGIALYRNWDNFQLGVSVGGGSLRAKGQYIDINPQSVKEYENYNVTVVPAQMFIAPVFVANLKQKSEIGYYYIGMSLGALMSSNNNTDFIQDTVTDVPISGHNIYYKSETGFLFGVQAGLIGRLTDKLNINAEIAYKHAFVDSKGLNYWPIMLGVSYNL